MSKKKPSLKGLPGKTVLTHEIRRKLKLDEKIITINARLWADVTSLVDDYFLNHELDYQDNAKNVYNNILLVFSKISTYDEPERSKCVVSQPLREYCTSVHNFLAQNQIYNQFLRYYDLQEIESRKRIQELYKEKEEEVTEDIMERRSIIRIGKRAQCDIDTFKKNKAASEFRKTRPLDDSIIESNKHFKISHTAKSNEEIPIQASSSISLDSTQIEEEEFEEEREDIEDIEEDQDPNSDLSIDHHPLRKGNYRLYQISEGPTYEDVDIQSDLASLWMVEDIDLSNECNQYRENCLVKRKPQQLDDVGLLAINHTYVFTESLSSSVTRHFDCAENHHAIISSLGVFERLPMANTNVYEWCAECISCSCKDLREVQATTVKFLNMALKSENDLDLIVANVLHQTFPLLKLGGYIDQRGEDSFAHDILSPLLNIIFSADVRLNHFWANIRLNKLYKDFKPDYGVFANGLSKRYVVVVAEFKPKEGRQQPESDFVKVGKQMRIMLNEALEIGVEDPVVCGILVQDDKLSTFKMHLADSKIYVMTQLSSMQLGKNLNDLAFIPGIVSRLHQLKELSLQTIKKVHAQAKKIKDGKTIVGGSVPTSWVSKTFYSLSRRNST